jgi:APA family basic amino acid/polyamine antiporter
VIGNMVGAGVFTTSGFALADLGAAHWVMLAWALGGLIALSGALSYGGLVTRIPRSGGEYTFLSEALHPLAGFLAGWISLLAGFTGPIAAAALVFESYADSAFGEVLPRRWTGTALIVIAGVLHGTRVRSGIVNLGWAVGLKLAALLAFVLYFVIGGTAGSAAGGTTALAEGWQTPLDIGAFGVTLVWVSFSYSGWNGAVYLASEIRDPERGLVRALWMSTLGVAILYLALNAVFLASAPAEALAGRPDVAAVAAEHLGGPGLRRGVAVVVGLALFTSVSAMMAAGPRVYIQMARDGFLPKRLAPARDGDAPASMMALQALLAIVVLWSTNLASLLGTLGFVLSLSSALCVAAAWRLRAREGAAAVPIPLFPLTPALYILAALAGAGFLIARSPGDALMGAIVMFSGLPVYAYMAVQRRRRD